jgi:osmoprotectant transport system permease protein
VKGLDHDLAYRGLKAGAIQVTDLYSTDAEIRYYDLVVLEDDRAFFRRYDAMVIGRADLPDRAPRFWRALGRLTDTIPEDEMIAMNAAAKLEREPESAVAARFVNARFGAAVSWTEKGLGERLLRRLAEHLALVAISLLCAILVAIPLGIAAVKLRRVEQPLMALVGIVQTVPSLALLVFMIPLLGIGAPPAIAALFLYSLLPIVRNTHAGLRDIALPVRESAEALGLSAAARLRHVELPLALSAILAGVKTSAVINIGTATLAALIGAGGFGQPILTGIRLDDMGLILEGAVPAALLAILAQLFFDGLERWLVPRGLRLETE